MATMDILNRAAALLGPDRVFGPPHTENGITVIPAATVRGGGGGGGGRSANDESGEGGGFGVSATPAGALVIDGTTVTWKPAFNPNRLVVAVQAVLIAWFAFHWLAERSRARARVGLARVGSG